MKESAVQQRDAADKVRNGQRTVWPLQLISGFGRAVGKTVRRAHLAVWLAIGVVACGPKPADEPKDLTPKHITTDQLPPGMRQSVERTAERQAVAAAHISTTVHRAYEYKGYSWYTPTSTGKLVAVDVEVSGYTADFDLDDIDLIDGATGESYGSNPQVALLRANGEVAKDEQKEWPPAPAPLRLLLIYAAPRSLKSVRLAYWDDDLTPSAVELTGTGPALRAPERRRKQ